MIRRPRTSRALAIVALVSASGVIGVAVSAAQKRAASDTSATVVATVNGEKITRGEVLDGLLADEAVRLTATDPRMQAQVKQQRPTAALVGSVVLQKMSRNGWKPVTISRTEIMDYAFKEKPDVLARGVDMLIQEKAIAQEARKQRVSATSAEVAKKITESFDNARKQNPGLAGKSDEAVMRAFGVRKQYIVPIVTTTVNLEKLAKKDMEVKLGHPLGAGDYRGASHILFKVNPAPPVSPDDKNPKPAEDPEKAWAEAKKKAEGVLADIRAGKITFEQAATQHSDDGSKFNQGSLGVFARGQMVPEFERAAFSQEKGKVGDLVRSPFGWHIIRVDKLGSELTGPERAEVTSRLLASKTQAKVQEIMGKAKIVNKVRPDSAMGMGMPGQGARPAGG